MNLAIMQPYLFPYIGYWQLINAVDKFVIYDDVNYIKQGYINRNSILANCKSRLVTLEIMGASSNKLINEIEVKSGERKMLSQIKQNYSMAPFYSEIMPLLEDILLDPEKNLAKFVGNSLIKIASYLKINTDFLYSSILKKNNNLKSQDKVINICQHLGASTYMNSIGGQHLYKKEDFNRLGIELKFIKPNLPVYSQFKNEFIPNLSIVDVLMFNDRESISIYINDFKLI